jgi:LPXTG-site transpeptidase (sortase) family protein
VDDTFITVNQAVYDNSNYTTQVSVNDGVALAIGRYRLLACGNSPYAPPALFDGVGNKMVADYVFNFVVAAKADEEDPITAATPLGLLPIPLTGFPQGKSTPLSAQPADRLFNSMDLVLEIPSLSISAPIVGVPLTDGTWNVSWLGDDIGWLAGSAYPTWSGNTVLTGHVWNTYNEPGVFFTIKDLSYGDEVLIHSGGQTYVYEVRENERVDPEASQIVFKHEELDWITLLTCEDFNPDLGGYDYRRYIRAVLINIY